VKDLNKGNVCDRDSQCINFRRSGATFCDECGVIITMNHYHDSVNNIRLCDRCFHSNFDEIVSGIKFSAVALRAEPRECANYDRCFEPYPYSMYVRKACCRCEEYPLVRHYHDIASNVRFCLTCLSVLKAHQSQEHPGVEPDLVRKL
jgi:hypothetical protein